MQKRKKIETITSLIISRPLFISFALLAKQNTNTKGRIFDWRRIEFAKWLAKSEKKVKNGQPRKRANGVAIAN